MQIVILAAGKGTRMRPLTDTIPKPMLPLKGKPKLEYTLQWLPKEVDEIIFVINYLGKQIQDYFGDRYSEKKVTYVLQEEMKGTGHAVHSCKDLLRDEFLVMFGDDLYHKDDVANLIPHQLALSAAEVDDPSLFGILISDEQGNLVEIREKPHQNESHLVNTGLFKLNRKFFDYPLVPVYNGTEYGLPQTLASMHKDHPIVIKTAKAWKSLGKVEDIAEAETALEQFI